MASSSSTNPTTPPSSSRLSTEQPSVSSSHSLSLEPPLTEQEIETKPWKYIGYKGYASFIASENDFYIVRRFASLNTRIALALQDQVSVLEEELEALDARYSTRDAEDLHNGSFRDDQEDRAALVERIAENLMKYSESAPPRYNSRYDTDDSGRCIHGPAILTPKSTPSMCSRH